MDLYMTYLFDNCLLTQTRLLMNYYDEIIKMKNITFSKYRSSAVLHQSNTRKQNRATEWWIVHVL